MKLLALVYSVVTLASLAIGTHAYDHQDESAHLRGTIEAIKFLTEDKDQCGLEGEYCNGNEHQGTCCSGLYCKGNKCEPVPDPLPCANEGESCDEIHCCKELVCDRRRCERPRPAEVLFAVDTNKD